MKDEAEKVFQELISLYDIADNLENNGEEEDAIQMRIETILFAKTPEGIFPSKITVLLVPQ